MSTYIHSIPYMFYAMVAIVVVPLFILGVMPKMGAMKKAYQRVETTGRVYSENSGKLNKKDDNDTSGDAKIIDFLIPIATMIIIQLVVGDMFIAIISAIISAAIIYVPRKKLKQMNFVIYGYKDLRIQFQH